MDLLKMLTEKNVGGWDRALRIMIGVVLIAAAAFMQQLRFSKLNYGSALLLLSWGLLAW